MQILLFTLSIIIFSKTLSYGIYEIKVNKNKSGRNKRYTYFHS